MYALCFKVLRVYLDIVICPTSTEAASYNKFKEVNEYINTWFCFPSKREDLKCL